MYIYIIYVCFYIIHTAYTCIYIYIIAICYYYRMQFHQTASGSVHGLVFVEGDRMYIMNLGSASVKAVLP